MHSLLHAGRTAQGRVPLQGDLSAVLGSDPGALHGHLAPGEDNGPFLGAPPKAGLVIFVNIAGSSELLDLLIDQPFDHQQARPEGTRQGSPLDGSSHILHQLRHGQDHLEPRLALGDLDLNSIVLEFLHFSSGPIRLLLIVLTHHAVSL